MSSGRILVVDDEPALAGAVADELRAQGYDVDEAQQSGPAIELALSRDYDLIVADLNMPGGGGRRLHRVLSERRPELAGRLLLMTGDARPEDDDLSLAGVACIEKPFTATALTAAAAEILRRARGA